MNKTLKHINDSEFLTVEEAANELGIKPTAIRNYLTWGKMNTYKFKTLTLVKKTEVEEWRKNHQG